MIERSHPGRAASALPRPGPESQSTKASRSAPAAMSDQSEPTNQSESGTKQESRSAAANHQWLTPSLAEPRWRTLASGGLQCHGVPQPARLQARPRPQESPVSTNEATTTTMPEP